jgi:hypothetical protein
MPDTADERRENRHSQPCVNHTDEAAGPVDAPRPHVGTCVPRIRGTYGGII